MTTISHVHKIDIVIVYSESNISFFIFAPQVPTRDKTKNITPHERMIVSAILSLIPVSQMNRIFTGITAFGYPDEVPCSDDFFSAICKTVPEDIEENNL